MGGSPPARHPPTQAAYRNQLRASGMRFSLVVGYRDVLFLVIERRGSKVKSNTFVAIRLKPC